MRFRFSFLAGLLLALVGTTAHAASMTIVATPQETGAPFAHNVFHSASGLGGASGTIFAWFLLDTSLAPGEVNAWDPVTGALEIHVNVYSTSAHTTLVGTAIGVSSNLFIANMNAPDAQNGGLIGNITWTIDAGALAFINGQPAAVPAVAATTSQAFVDRKYTATTAGGFQPNSTNIVGGMRTVTLWGADTASLLNTATSGDNFNTVTTSLGTDLVFQVVPLPAPLLLLGSGLVALVGLRHRQARGRAH